MKFMPDNVEHWPIDRPVPYEKNARTHSDEQVDQIAASMREFGFTNPILVDGTGCIIAGHGRLQAAKLLGLTEVPVIVLAHLTDEQRRAYILADNKLALNAGWDDAMLAAELALLRDDGFELSLIGFSDDELADLLPEPEEEGEGTGDDDAVPEVPEEPTTVLGDVWVMGKHRLMCGDSTSIDAVELLMGGIQADLIFTDPPYGMSYGGGRGKKEFGMIANDDAQGDDLVQLVQDSITSARAVCKGGAAAYVCFPISACIVWDKKSFGLGNSNYRPQHEFIFYSKGDGWYGDRSQADVWYMSRGNTAGYVHPTQKPVELVERVLEHSSKKGDTVLDVFGGSGSTLIACEKTGRAARLMELDPKYCDVIVKRWQEFTGKVATHAESDKTFAELCRS